jgi:hypothetical protein
MQQYKIRVADKISNFVTEGLTLLGTASGEFVTNRLSFVPSGEVKSLAATNLKTIAKWEQVRHDG